MKGTCKLCGEAALLKESHIIPRFVGKWVKKTSITGYLRMNTQMDKRAQDTAKEFWLCDACEQLFSNWEREFANKVFYPYVDKNISTVNYDSWLSKFCASLSWRSLVYIRSLNPKDDESPNKEVLDETQEHLRKYLLGEVDNLNHYEQHIFPLDAIETTTMGDMPTSINRYLLRAFGLDIVGNSSEKFIYTKLPSFILLGVVKVEGLSKMRASRIALKTGQLSPRKYLLPAGFRDYLFNKANQIMALHKEIPEQHLASFEQHVRENPDKVVNSKQFQAFLHDYNRFGNDVFK